MAQIFPNLVAGSTILSTIGQVSFSHPRDPLLKNSIKEISFFLRGRKYRGNIVPNLQSSDPWPTSSDAGPYLHRESIGEMGEEGEGQEEGGWKGEKEGKKKNWIIRKGYEEGRGRRKGRVRKRLKEEG